MDAWSILGLVIIVAIAAFGIRLLKLRMDEQRYRQELADMEFEGSLLSDYSSGVDLGEDHRFQQATVVSSVLTPEAELPHPPANYQETPVLSQPQHDDPIAADKAVPYAMQQLQQSGLLREVEGYLELHGNAKGVAIIRLRNGKRALLVPNMESEGFFRRHARRADMIIVAGSDGKAIVVTPLEELISQNILPGL